MILSVTLPQVYHKLVQTKNFQVKMTLAQSLHEIARILGPGQLVEEELMAVFEEMIQVNRRRLPSIVFIW